MNLEIIKDITLTGIGVKKVGDSLDMRNELANILISMGFAKEGKKATLTANEVSDLIGECMTLEDLGRYSTDKRQIVASAFKKRLKELE